MTALERLGGAQLVEVVACFRDALRAHQDTINRLNVYPVPDGDTGTNMALTLESVVAELDDVDAGDLDAVCRAIAHGSLMGARGNSGVILSQVMRGLTQTVRDAATVDARSIATALDAASTSAYAAVMRPVEGTILTVVREAAAGATTAAADGAALVTVLDAAKSAGDDALARTPEMLPVLAEAGVVDAGGTGFVLLLDAFLHVVDGRPLPEATADEGIVSATPHLVLVEGGDMHHDDVSDLRYEVMYFLEAPDDAVPAFKEVWAGIGDSIVVVGGDGIWNCHIHTDDIGAAIEAAIDCGRPRKIRVTDLMEQVEEERWVREAGEEPTDAVHHQDVPCAVIAVATGAGVRRLLGSLGVQHIVAGGQSMNPSTAQLLEAVEAVPSQEVVILPNNKNIVAVAQQVDAETDKKVTVVPTHSVTQGLAALLTYDPQTTAEANAVAMSEAASAVLIGEVTQAVRDTTTDVGAVRTGDFIGITAHGIRSVHVELVAATIALLDDLVTDDHEIVGILEGEGSSPAATRAISEWLNDHRPDVEVEVHAGGQPLYPYCFGVE
jgi:DAK2 domain fusion protein YloV